MGQISYRANLSAATFPLVSEFQGQSIIVKQYDNNYVPSISSKDDADKDAGVPQIYYCHNVLPNAQGFGAVGYQKITLAAANQLGFNSMYILRDNLENKAYFCHTADGSNYILLPGSFNWLKVNTIPGTAGKLVTIANISGQTYVYFAGIGCYKYDFANSVFNGVTLTGLNPTSIIGITTTAGYMIAWTLDSIAWSSTILPTDFVPSLTTGAGGGGVEGAKGSIQVCISTIGGFIVYTTNNAVVAAYSGNSRYPFGFREIVGAGGLSNAELASSDGNTGSQYAYTTYGLQLVGVQNAQVVLPEITDFIAGSYFEDFNETTLAFSRTKLSQTLMKKITLISSRYIIISYGISELTHALVYDLGTKRFGKLKITHVDCFEYNLLNPEIIETPKKSIAFLQKDGSVQLLDSAFGSQYLGGVMLLGKYQYVRQRMLQLDTVELENVIAGDTFSLLDLSSLDGKNSTAKVGYLLESKELYRKYAFDTVGTNHSLMFIGSFYIVSLVLNFNVHGEST